MGRLTEKKRRLCHRIVETGESHVAAYRAVYADNSNPNGARVRVCNLLKEPEVIEYMESLRERAREKVDRGVQELVAQFDEDRKFARENGNPSAAVTATTKTAEILGLMVKKHDVNIGFRPGEAREYVKSILSKYADRLGE